MMEVMKLGELTVRRSRVYDVEHIKRIEDRAFSPHDRFSTRRFRYLLSSPNCCTMLCFHGESAIGYGMALKSRLRNGAVKGRVYSLAVTPAWQRHGVGKLLMDHLERWLAGSHAGFITLEARGKNRRAIQFYRKRGYQVFERLPGYYASGDGLRLRRAI
jgi:ribosomal protein S18 acetylase RimI-like enzyme